MTRIQHEPAPVRYLGHLPGSGVQAHSAGEHFPYVIAVVESHGDRWFEVTGPGIPALRCETSGDAVYAARRLAIVSKSDEAWAFDIERVSTCAGTKVGDVVEGLKFICGAAFEGRSRFDELTPRERVYALYYAGVARRIVHRSLPIGQPPFAAWLAVCAQRAKGLS